MNLDPLRRLQSKFSAALVAAAALVLTSCGGGGATGSPTAVGNLELLPGTASFYAGVPYTLNIAGGRGPFLVTSSEPTLIALNFTTSSNNFTLIANNPGVVDVGLDPDEVPRRTVSIQVRDSNGATFTAAYNVLQNFFTGYSQNYSSTCASAGASGPAPQACSGTDTIVTLFPVSQGTLYGNREFQFDRVRGDYSFVQEPPGANPQLLNTIRVRTDQTGKAMVRLRVGIGAPTQLATYKVTDVATGVTTDLVFLIIQQAPIGTITVVPGGTITFTGANGACGFGSSDQFVFDGTPPYTIIPPLNVGVNPLTLAANGDRFTVTVGQGAPVTACPSGPVIVSDTQGRRATVQVTSAIGGTPPPIVVSPAFTPSLTCTSNTATVAVIGGVGPLSAVSNHPRVTAVISGFTLTVTRAPSGDGATIYPASATIVITDGAALTNLAVPGVSPNCP